MSTLVIGNPAGTELPNGVQGIALGTRTQYSEAVVRHEVVQREKQFFLFEAASKHKAFFLSAPIWLAAVFTLLAYVGGPEVQRVLQFMAPWSSAPFQR